MEIKLGDGKAAFVDKEIKLLYHGNSLSKM
jgi:hypothetical protein